MPVADQWGVKVEWHQKYQKDFSEVLSSNGACPGQQLLQRAGDLYPHFDDSPGPSRSAYMRVNCEGKVQWSVLDHFTGGHG